MVILSLTEQIHLPWILWVERENTHQAPLILLSVRVLELQKLWNKLLTLSMALSVLQGRVSRANKSTYFIDIEKNWKIQSIPLIVLAWSWNLIELN